MSSSKYLLFMDFASVSFLDGLFQKLCYDVLQIWFREEDFCPINCIFGVNWNLNLF